MSPLDKIIKRVRILSVFSTPFDFLKYRKLSGNKLINSKDVSLGIREAKNKVVLRPNTRDGVVFWDTFYNKYHIPPVQLRDDAIIVDLGANVGYTMVHFAHIYPKSHIYGVEMDFDNFMLAKKNLNDLGEQCMLIHSAVWSDDGHIKYDKNMHESGYHVQYNDSQKEKSILREVPAKSLNTIFSEFNLKRVDYLKMDIEGAEKFVLEKPDKWINIVRMMKIEVHPPADLDICLQTLKKYGFRCYKDDKHWSAIVAIKDEIQ